MLTFAKAVLQIVQDMRTMLADMQKVAITQSLVAEIFSDCERIQAEICENYQLFVIYTM